MYINFSLKQAPMLFINFVVFPVKVYHDKSANVELYGFIVFVHCTNAIVQYCTLLVLSRLRVF